MVACEGDRTPKQFWLTSLLHSETSVVLLGDPGAGKTTSFKHAAEQQNAHCVSVRELLAGRPTHIYSDQPLFIDGLDEARVGRGELGEVTTEKLVAAIRASGCRHFSLSCREADWFGELDAKKLRGALPSVPLSVVSMDPLTKADVRLLVSRQLPSKDVSAFLHWAEQNSMDTLMTNPQTLVLLCEVVVGTGTYPSSRRETFEEATRLMIKETNLEHEAAYSLNPIGVDAVLDAAGRLCTILLVGDLEGFALRASVETPRFPETNGLTYSPKPELQAALRSRFFTRVSTGLVGPRHREIAEFLAARYLSRELQTGNLLIERLIALVTGNDGVVTNSQRGMVAWLASLCQEPDQLLRRDPLGAILYGDVRQLSSSSRIQLMGYLHDELERNPRFWFSRTGSERLAGLLDEDMAAELQKRLLEPSRIPASQRLVVAVLEAMYLAPTLPSLLPSLAAVVADSTRWPGVRHRALTVMQRYESSIDPEYPQCVALLANLRTGDIEDDDLKMTGSLFSELYPHHVSVDEVFSHLCNVAIDETVGGDYKKFWHHDLILNTPSEQWPHVMDFVLASRSSLLRLFGGDAQHELEFSILVAALNYCPAGTPASRVFDWFGLGIDEYGDRSYVRSEQVSAVKSWLKERSIYYQSMLEHAVKIGCQSSEPSHFFNRLSSRFLWIQNEIDCGLWSMQLLAHTTCDAGAQYLLQLAVDHLSQSSDSTLTLDNIFDNVANNQQHTDLLNSMLRCEVSERHYEYRKRLLLNSNSLAGKINAWQSAVEVSKEKLLEGQPPYEVLEFIGKVYGGYYTDFQNKTAVDRLRAFYNNEATLVAMRTGLRRAIEYPKIPTVPEIINSYVRGSYYPIAYAVLGGVLDLETEMPGTALALNESESRLVVALLLVLQRSEFEFLLDMFIAQQPALVASIVKDIIERGFRARTDKLALVEMLNQNKAKSVADLIAVDLVSIIPLRLRIAQLSLVRQLLNAAIRTGQHSDLGIAVQQRLEISQLSVAERACWLVAGALIDPPRFFPALETFLTSGRQRMAIIAGEVLLFRDVESLFQKMNSHSLSLWIERLGQYWQYKPWGEKVGIEDYSDQGPDYLTKLIKTIAGMNDRTTADEIRRLKQLPKLECWSGHLEIAAFDQQQVQRELSYQVPDIASIEATLDSRSPANVADLQAIVMIHLTRIASRVQNASTNDFRQYWNEDSNQNLTIPKVEDSCRDCLLSDLMQALLPLGIDPTKEGYYVNDKRADIRVSFAEISISLPVEIKQNMHRDVWIALEEQLIARYTRESEGYGIYLCFWFGTDTDTKMPLFEGWRPASATEFHNKLVSTIPDTHRHKIKIVVVDVSNPTLSDSVQIST